MFGEKTLAKIRVGNTTILAISHNVYWNEVVRIVLDTITSFYRLILEKKENITVFGRRVIPQDYVEVHFYSDTNTMYELLVSEASSLGASETPFYTVMHDAWRGFPRIHVDLAAASNTEVEVLKSLISHEAAHSILHGSLEYYLVEVRNMNEALILSLLAAGCKDIEVFELLRLIGLQASLLTYLEWFKDKVSNYDCSIAEDAALAFKEMAIFLYLSSKPPLSGVCGNVVDLLYSYCLKLLEEESAPGVKYRKLYEKLTKLMERGLN